MNGPVSTTASKDKSARQASERSPERPRQPAVSGPQADMLALQRAAGNLAVSQLLRTPEANGMTSGTSSPAGPFIQRKPVENIDICPTCGRQGRDDCLDCGEPILPLQRKENTNASSSNTGLNSVHSVITSGGGQPLDSGTRSFMESRFNHDFSQVRVHTNNQATASARAINARAYTIGQDMVFASGQYNPEDADGQSLLAHELAHVIQQKHVSSTEPMHYSKVQVGATTNTFEAEADRASEAIATNSPVQVSQRVSIPYIQRARWGKCPPGRRLSALRRPDRNGPAELFALVIYRTARAGNLVISNVDLLEDIPARGRHQRMLRAMQERFRTFGSPSPIRPTERVGDIPDIPTYPGQGSLEPIQGQRPQLEEATQNLLRPDIIDMDRREVYDVTSIDSAHAKVDKVNYYARRLEAIRRTEGIGGRRWRVGRSLSRPSRIVYPILRIRGPRRAREVVCYGSTDLARRPGVISYEIIERGRRRKRRRRRRGRRRRQQPRQRRQMRQSRQTKRLSPQARRRLQQRARRRVLRQAARSRALRRRALRQAARSGLRMAGRRVVGRLAARLALRAIPFVGWVMLAIDIAEIGYALAQGARFGLGGGGGSGADGGGEGSPGGQEAEGETKGTPGGEAAEGGTEATAEGETAEGGAERTSEGEAAEGDSTDQPGGQETEEGSGGGSGGKGTKGDGKPGSPGGPESGQDLPFLAGADEQAIVDALPLSDELIEALRKSKSEQQALLNMMLGQMTQGSRPAADETFFLRTLQITQGLTAEELEKLQTSVRAVEGESSDQILQQMEKTLKAIRAGVQPGGTSEKEPTGRRSRTGSKRAGQRDQGDEADETSGARKRTRRRSRRGASRGKKKQGDDDRQAAARPRVRGSRPVGRQRPKPFTGTLEGDIRTLPLTLHNIPHNPPPRMRLPVTYRGSDGNVYEAQVWHRIEVLSEPVRKGNQLLIRMRFTSQNSRPTGFPPFTKNAEGKEIPEAIYDARTVTEGELSFRISR